MIEFLTPYALFGLLAAGLPVAIHLLTRPRPTTVRFPLFQLLKDAGSGRQAIKRLQADRKSVV